MTKIQAILYKVFGASWFLSLLGYIIIAGTFAEMVQEYLATNAIPTNPQEWFQMIVGIALRASKQANVSNAAAPLAVAQTVVPISGQSQAEKPTPIMAK